MSGKSMARGKSIASDRPHRQAREILPQSARAENLVDRLGKIARESEDIRRELGKSLAQLIARRDELAADMKLVESEISARLLRMRKAAAAVEAGREIPLTAEPTGRLIDLADLPRKPIVPVENSILKDSIVCLIDGEKRKMLHRHLKTKYGITPEQYRKHFSLPPDYPMTAPGYSSSQSKAVARAVEEGRLIPPGAREKRGWIPAAARS